MLAGPGGAARESKNDCICACAILAKNTSERLGYCIEP